MAAPASLDTPDHSVYKDKPPLAVAPPLPSLVFAAVGGSGAADLKPAPADDTTDHGDEGGDHGANGEAPSGTTVGNGSSATESKPGQVVLLTATEQSLAASIFDLAFSFAGRTEPARLVESLSRALAEYPGAAGRLVRRKVRLAEPGQGPTVSVRTCILCNNAGVPFSTRDVDIPALSVNSPLPDWCFDRILDLRPGPSGAPSESPLLKVRVVSFNDGQQLLTLSFSRALSDPAGMAVFLQSWATLHRGEELAYAWKRPPLRERLDLEFAIRAIEPRLAADFTLLHRGPGDVPPCPPLIEPAVVSLHLDGEHLARVTQELSEECRKKRTIFNSDVLTPEETAIASVADTIEVAMPTSMVINYREVFAVEFSCSRHFGNSSGNVEFELSGKGFEAAGILRKRFRTTKHREFWAWKLQQEKRPGADRLIIESLLDSFDLQKIGFDAGTVVGMGMSGSFWKDWFRDRGPEGVGGVVLLPQADGIQVAGLLPRDAAFKFQEKFGCKFYHPDLI